MSASNARTTCWCRLAGLVLLLALLTACQSTPHGEWPGFRGNGNAEIGSIKPAFELKKLWQMPVEGECKAGLAAANGVVVIADHGADTDFWSCRDARTGEMRWQVRLPNAVDMDFGNDPRATPLIDGDRVYCLSAVGELLCLDLNTGERIWQRNLNDEFATQTPEWGYSSSPRLDGRNLLINPGAEGASVAALDTTTGEVVWEGDGGPSNYSSFAVGTLGGVRQLITYDIESLGGWDLTTGKRLWRLAVEQHGYIVPTPIVIGEKLFVTDHVNGSRLYAFTEGGKIQPKPVAVNLDLVSEIVTPIQHQSWILGHTYGLVCLDATTLKTLWREEDDDTLTGSTVYFIGAGERVLAFSCDDGTLVDFTATAEGCTIHRRYTLCEETQAHPAIAEGRLFVRDAEAVTAYQITR